MTTRRGRGVGGGEKGVEPAMGADGGAWRGGGTRGGGGVSYTFMVWADEGESGGGAVGGRRRPAAMSGAMTAPRMYGRFAGGSACQHH